MDGPVLVQDGLPVLVKPCRLCLRQIPGPKGSVKLQHPHLFLLVQQDEAGDFIRALPPI